MRVGCCPMLPWRPMSHRDDRHHHNDQRDHNPQAAEMADESMVRNLAAQAEAIWPQERALFGRYQLPAAARIVDVGCGTGEISARLCALLPAATLVGVDLDAAHLARARARCTALGGGDRARFAVGDAFALPAPDATFDLTVCRHLVQAVPDAPRVLAELVRVTRPGGRVHVIAEDYGLMHFHPTRLDADRFWREGAMAYGDAIGVDLRIGRKTPALLAGLGLRELSCEYVLVDTLRVARPTFAAIWRAWRDGYTDPLAVHTRLSRDEITAHFDDMIACIENPAGYAVWHVPVVSGVK